MLSRLTGTRRTTAGRLLALVYLFCVLAPAMSFAFADGARAAACLTEDEHGMGIVLWDTDGNGFLETIEGYTYDDNALAEKALADLEFARLVQLG
mgnify:CR=1 FL=1